MRHHLERGHVIVEHLELEHFFELGLDALQVRVMHREAQHVVRRRLGHHQRGNLFLTERGKHLGGELRKAQRVLAADGDQVRLADRGDGFHSRLAVGRRGPDLGPRAGGIEAVLDPHRDLFFHHRLDSLGVEHLGAEKRKLDGFAVRDFGDDARGGDQARVGGHHPVHVGPDPDLARVEGRAHDGAAVIRAAAAERRAETFASSAPESSDHRDDPATAQTGQALPGHRVGLVEQRRGVAEVIVGDDQFRGVDRLRRHAF